MQKFQGVWVCGGHGRTLSQSAWLMWPPSTISAGLMGTSWLSALVVGVMTLAASRSFFAMPSGNRLPQYSRSPAL